MALHDALVAIATGAVRGPSGTVLRRFSQGCVISALNVWAALLTGRNVAMRVLRGVPLDLETPALWLGLVVGSIVALAFAMLVVALAVPIVLLALALACVFAAGRVLMGGNG